MEPVTIRTLTLSNPAEVRAAQLELEPGEELVHIGGGTPMYLWKVVATKPEAVRPPEPENKWRGNPPSAAELAELHEHSEASRPHGKSYCKRNPSLNPAVITRSSREYFRTCGTGKRKMPSATRLPLAELAYLRSLVPLRYAEASNRRAERSRLLAICHAPKTGQEGSKELADRKAACQGYQSLNGAGRAMGMCGPTRTDWSHRGHAQR